MEEDDKVVGEKWTKQSQTTKYNKIVRLTNFWKGESEREVTTRIKEKK